MDAITQAPQVPPAVQAVIVLAVVFVPLAVAAWRIRTTGGDR